MTLLFIPDTTGLDLREQDRYWSFVRAGKATEYHGIAVHPRHLSWYERLVLKRHLAYDPELDRAQRVEELRAMHELRAADVGKEGTGMRGDASAEDDDDELTSSASTYFSECTRLPSFLATGLDGMFAVLIRVRHCRFDAKDSGGAFADEQ